MSLNDDFKIKNVFHLVGEQTLPVYLAAIQFPAATKHYLLATEKTKKSAERIGEALHLSGITSEIKMLGKAHAALSYMNLLETIKAIVKEAGEPQHGAFDVTGGTKLMAFAGLIAANTSGMPAFYVDSPEQKFICVNRTNVEYPLESDMHLDDFVALSGLKLRKPRNKTLSVDNDLLEYMFQNAEKFQRYQATFALIADTLTRRPADQKSAATFETTYNEMTRNMRGWHGQWETFCAVNGIEKKKAVQAQFLAGGWLEYYAYELVRASDPRIKEVLINAEVTISRGNGDLPFQEFDVVYTDGYSLFILECKAGQIFQEYIQKLENICSEYCGALGKCALVTMNSSKTENSRKARFAERVERSRAIAAFCGKGGIRQLQSGCSIEFKPGKIYE